MRHGQSLGDPRNPDQVFMYAGGKVSFGTPPAVTASRRKEQLALPPAPKTGPGFKRGSDGRRFFSAAFKLAAVKRLAAGESISELSDILKVHTTVLNSWRKKIDPKAGA